MLTDEKRQCNCSPARTADSPPIRTDYVKIQKDSTGEWFVGIDKWPVYAANGTPLYLEEKEIWSIKEEDAKVFPDWAVPFYFKITKDIMRKFIEEDRCLTGWYKDTYTPKQIYIKLKF